MGQTESQQIQASEDGCQDNDLALLVAAFLGEDGLAAEGTKSRPPGGPRIEVLQEGKWTLATWLPNSFSPNAESGTDPHVLKVMQREEHGIWADLEPAESALLLSVQERVVYRRDHVPCEADLKKMTWRTGCHHGHLRMKPQPVGGLARWLRWEPPLPPLEEAGGLAAWCVRGAAPAPGRREGALLWHHHHRRAVAARLSQQGEDACEAALERAHAHSSACGAYAGALGRLAVEPALVGTGAETVLQILEMQLSALPPLAISCGGVDRSSPALITALGFSEAFRCSLFGEKALPPQVACRVVGLLLRIGLQTGLVGPVLVAVTWLLSSKAEVGAVVEEELRPLAEAIHYLNGPQELEVMRGMPSPVPPQVLGGTACAVCCWEKVPQRYSPMDWPRGPALIQSFVRFPGAKAADVGASGVRCVVRLAGESSKTRVGLCAPDAAIVSHSSFDSVAGLVMFGQGRAVCCTDAIAARRSVEFGPQVFHDGDEIELILNQDGVLVAVNGKSWGAAPEVPEQLWSSGARVFVALSSSRAQAEIDVWPQPREGADSGPSPAPWAAVAGQLDFESLWQRASTAREGRVASVLLHCIGRNAQAYVNIGPSKDPPPVVEESEHKYSPNMNLWRQVHIPGALQLRVEFDERCATERGRDVLAFYKDKDQTTPLPNVEPMSGDARNFKSFEVQGSSFWYNFTSDGSEEAWGYKFTVTAVRFARNCSVLPLVAENVGTGVSESLELLLQHVIDRRPLEESSLRSIFLATGAELHFLATLQPAWRAPASKAAMQPVLRALLRAAEAEFPWVQPSNLAETLAVEALRVAGPEVAGDLLSRLELIVAMLENSSCPPALASAIDRTLKGDEHYAQLMSDPATASALLARLAAVVLDRQGGAPTANRAQAARMLLQVLGDILSELASCKSRGSAKAWEIVRDFAVRILTGAAEVLAALQEGNVAHHSLFGLLTPALLRGLALALPATPQNFLLPLLPALRGLRTAAELAVAASAKGPRHVLEELVASSLALQQALGLGLLARGETREGCPEDGIAEALKCLLIRSVPGELLAEVAESGEGEEAALVQAVAAVESYLELAPRAEVGADRAPHAILEEFVCAETPGSVAAIKQLDAAAGRVLPTPASAAKVRRLGFVVLVRHYGLEEQLAELVAAVDGSQSPMRIAASKALGLLWRQAHDLAQEAQTRRQQASRDGSSSDVETAGKDIEAHLRFALQCAGSECKKLDIDDEEAVSAAQEEAREALEVRQGMFGASDVGDPGTAQPVLSRGVSEVGAPPTEDVPAPPLLSRWASAPAAHGPPAGACLAAPSGWSALRRQISTVRVLQLSLKPLRAILAAEGSRGSELRPVDQLKQLLRVPFRGLLEAVRNQSRVACCVAASLHLLSAGVRAACRVSAAATLEALPALRVAWQRSLQAARLSAQAEHLVALRAAQRQAVAAMVEAAERTPGDAQERVQVQAVALCGLCGPWGPHELKVVEQLAEGALAGVLPWARAAEHGELEGRQLPVRCAAWLCALARVAATHKLPREQREAALGRLCGELLAVQPGPAAAGAVVKTDLVPPTEHLTLLAVFAPIGGISSQAGVRSVREGWQGTASVGTVYFIEGPEGLSLRSSGPELNEGMDPDHVRELIDSQPQHIIVSGIRFERGRHYWEISVDECPEGALCVNAIGVAGAGAPSESKALILGDACWGITCLDDGLKLHGGDPAADDASDCSFPAFTTGMVVGLLLDCDAGTLSYFVNGEATDVSFDNLQGKGPFSPCAAVGLGAGLVFTLHPRPSALPPGTEDVSTLPPVSRALASGRTSLGGLGVCAERPTLAWLLSLGWVAAAIGKDALRNKRALVAELVNALLSVLLAGEQEEPINKALAGLLLEGLPVPSNDAAVAAMRLLTSIAADEPGWVRAGKAAVLRHWCTSGPLPTPGLACGSGVWAALIQALGQGGSLRCAALNVVAEPAALRCLGTVKINGAGCTGAGTVVDVSRLHVALLPAEPAATVTWHGQSWPAPRRCPPPFPEELMSVALSTAQKLLVAEGGSARENVNELFALLAMLEDPSMAQAIVGAGLIHRLSHLVLAWPLEPQLGGAWKAVPAASRVHLCTVLLARPRAAEVLRDAMRRTGKSVTDIFAAAMVPGLLVPYSSEDATTTQEGAPRLWRRPRSPVEGLLSRDLFNKAVRSLVEESLTSVEVNEIWESACEGKELQMAASTPGGKWKVSPPEGGEPASWTALAEEASTKLDMAIAEGRAACTVNADVLRSGAPQELTADFVAMTLWGPDQERAMRLTRDGPTEPAVDLAEFESMLNQAPAEKTPPRDSSVGMNVGEETPASEVPQPESPFTEALRSLGLAEVDEPRSRDALLQLVASAPADDTGVLKCALPPLSAKEKRKAKEEGAPESGKDDNSKQALEELLRRSTAPVGIEGVALWAQNHLARLVCAKAVSYCKALEPEAIGLPMDAVRLLLAIRPLCDMPQLQERLRPALSADRGLSAAFQQAATAEFLGVLRDTLKPVDPVRHEESSHPYSDNTDEWKEVCIPGAKNLRVVFDPRCATEPRHDWLEFCTGRGGARLPGTSGQMSGRDFANFDVEGDSFWYHFHSDGSTTDWGFKFTVTANPPLVPKTSYWQTDSSTPNMEDACWLLQVALEGAIATQGREALPELRSDVLVPILLALAERLPQEEGRTRALMALSDVFNAVNGEPAQLWCELHGRLLNFGTGSTWSTQVGQVAAALLVRLAQCLPEEPLRLRFGASMPAGAALLDPAGAQALFLQDGAACVLEGAVVRSGEAASMHLAVSEGVRVGVAPGAEGPVDASQCVAVQVSPAPPERTNRWSADSPGIVAGAATLSGADGEVLKSARMEGTNYVVRAERAYDSGVHYWEIKCLHRDGGGNGYHIIGIAAEGAKESFTGSDCGRLIWGLWLDEAVKVHNSERMNMQQCRVDHGDDARYGVLLDCDAGTLSFYSRGKNVGGVSFENLNGVGPFYPILCVGCLESNTYQVNFSPQEVPDEVADMLTSGHSNAAGRLGGSRGVYAVTCDLRGGPAAARLHVADEASLTLPAGAAAWRFVVLGSTGAEAALVDRGAHATVDGALARAQAAMETVMRGGADGPLPEFAEDAFAVWNAACEAAQEAPAAAGQAEEEQPPWASLGPDQLVVFGAGCAQCNGVYTLIATEPITYLSHTEGTIANDRDGHWVMSPSFNVEVWVYEAPAREGPWKPRAAASHPPPTVCGSAGPPKGAPGAPGGEAPPGGAEREAPKQGLGALLRRLRGTPALVAEAADTRVRLLGSERLAVALEGGGAVEVLGTLHGEERSVVLQSGEEVEVASESCLLRPLIEGPPLGWCTESGKMGSVPTLFRAKAIDRACRFDTWGLLTRGPMLFFSEEVARSKWTDIEVEVARRLVRCRVGHVMRPRPQSGGWHCDQCGASGSQLLRFRCNENCNWDYCGKCQQEFTCGLWLDQKTFKGQGAKIAAGDRVLAHFTRIVDQRGHPVKRPAVVAEARANGTFLVSWDDGDMRDREKFPAQIFPRNDEGRALWVIKGVRAHGPVADWNAANPDRAIRRGDRIFSVRGVEADVDAVCTEMLRVDDEVPLKLGLHAARSRQQLAPAIAALTWPGLFQQWSHADSGFKFAASPEIRVCDVSGALEVGVCNQAQEGRLLSAGCLPSASVVRGDILRLLVVIGADGGVVALQLLRNGVRAASWEHRDAEEGGSGAVEVQVAEARELRLWVISTSVAEGPRRQGRAALQLLPLAATGPRVPAGAPPLESPSNTPAGAWEAFLAWWPQAAPTHAVAWPVGRGDQLRLLEEITDRVRIFQESALSGWKIEADEELILNIESLAKEKGKRLLDEAALEFEPKHSKRWAVAGRCAEAGYARYLILRSLNTLIQHSVLPFVELGMLRETPHGRALHALKRLLFSEVRGTAVQPAGDTGRQVKLKLNRFSATACKEAGECDVNGNQMLFAQASLVKCEADTFRRSGQNWQDQPFTVSYEDEAGVDQGGLYRDFFDTVAEELMSQHLPLFLPTANQSTNAGDHRDTWVINPALEVGPGSAGERMLIFLGRLMGLCLLRGDILPLCLPPSFWKSLQGEDVGLPDLEAIDVAAANSVKMLREPESLNITADSFGDTFPDLRFVVEDSANQRRELLEGGAGRPVRFEDAPQYAEMMLSLRLRESEHQFTVLRNGIQEVAKHSSWALWPWQKLAEKIVGVSHIDVALLRRKTKYEGYDAESHVVKRFWAAMESLSQKELKQFLHFVWGRSRLPPEASDKWGNGFKVSRAARSDSLPLAHTCFFQLELPEYETDELMRERILFAVENCVSISLA